MTDPRLITLPDIAAALGLPMRTVYWRAKKESWPKDETPGGQGAVYPLETLPPYVQSALAALPAEASGAVAIPPVPYIYNDRVEAGSPDLPDWNNKVALARADLIRAYLEEKRRTKAAGQSMTQAARAWLEAYNTGVPMPNVYAVLGRRSFSTVEAWARTFRTGLKDFTDLSPRWGVRRGSSKLTENEKSVLLDFVRHENKLVITEVIRWTKKVLAHQSLPSPSSEATMRRFVLAWKSRHYDKWVFSREGDKALNDKCLPYRVRDWDRLAVGDVLVADGHVTNFEIIHPETGRPKRMSWIPWYDGASRYPAGYSIMPTENAGAVSAGLRRAILRLGKMPKVAYLDNGKAFRAKVFTSQDLDFEEAGFYGLFARLGIETVFAWPYHGQSKPIERFFGTFAGFERLMPTYTGTSIANKPARLLRNEKVHRRLHERKYGGWAPTLDQAYRIIDAWIADYAGRPHSALGGRTPLEVFEAGRGPGVDETALRHLMMSQEIKTINRNGVCFRGRNYFDEALYGLRDRVLIRYDDLDPDSVLVYDLPDMAFRCEARAVEKVHPLARLLGTAEDVEAVKAGISLKRRLRRRTVEACQPALENTPILVAFENAPEPAPSLNPVLPLPPVVSLSRGSRSNDLWVERLGEGRGEGRKKLPRLVTKDEEARLEAAAARMTCSDLSVEDAPVRYETDSDRYEDYLERSIKGCALESVERRFMDCYESTDLYQTLKPRYDLLMEFWSEEGALDAPLRDTVTMEA
ncbi:MAG: Mu transposase C-terminal domain-containing protein [Thermodesulfobacteriota bacterium]